jgi:DNA-binding response OmpR family regulator
MTTVHSIRLVENDSEAGSALALLLAAAGYEVATRFENGLVVISANAQESEIRLLDEDVPHISAYDLACQMRTRLDQSIFDGENDSPELSSAFHNVA